MVIIGNLQYKELLERFSSYKNYIININNRYEQLLWEKAFGKGDLFLYKKYTNKYPRGEYYNNAVERMKILIEQALYEEDNLAWKKAKQENSIESYKQYIDDWRNDDSEIFDLAVRYEGIHLQEAQKIIKQKEWLDQHFWENVLQSDTIESYERYIENYPNGLYISEAKLKADELIRIKCEKELAIKKEKDLLISFIKWADKENISEGKIPRDIRILKELTHLDISGGHLRSIPESIGCLINLIELDLADNNLERLPSSIGNLVKLKKLYVTKNNLNNLPDTFSNLKNLEFLLLSGGFGTLALGVKTYSGKNSFSFLPNCVRNLKSLKTLVFAETETKTIPDWINELQNLRVLFLSGNKQLSEITESVYQLKNLENLALAHNNIYDLSESIGQLNNLEHLDIGYNNISKLPDSLSNLEYLGSISMSDNNIKVLPDDLYVNYIYTPKNRFSIFKIIKYKFKYGAQGFIV